MIIKNDINPNDMDLLIYDVDGTLVEFKTLQKLLKESFLICDVYEVLDFEKEYLKEYVSSVSKALNPNEKNFSFNKLARSFEKNFTVCRDYKIPGIYYLKVLLDLERKYTKIIDGVKETLPSLYSDYRQVISTNWFGCSQKAKLDKYGLCRYFEKIYSCEENYPKPNERHFKLISDEYKTSPKRCLVIGDSFTDIGAYQYGYNTLLVDYRSNKSNLYNNSNAVVTEFSDIKKILKK